MTLYDAMLAVRSLTALCPFFMTLDPSTIHLIDYWQIEDRQEAYEAILSKYNEYGFSLGMDENHVGENLFL